MIHWSILLALNTITKGELSDPLCDSVNRGLTLVRLIQNDNENGLLKWKSLILSIIIYKITVLYNHGRFLFYASILCIGDGRSDFVCRCKIWKRKLLKILSSIIIILPIWLNKIFSPVSIPFLKIAEGAGHVFSNHST